MFRHCLLVYSHVSRHVNTSGAVALFTGVWYLHRKVVGVLGSVHSMYLVLKILYDTPAVGCKDWRCQLLD